MSQQCAKADILEDDLLVQDVLCTLLADHSSQKNIIWATDEYVRFGAPYKKASEISPILVTGSHGLMIQPRSAKPLQTKQMRIRNRGEVFTPSWICNKQNNLIDDAWFGRNEVFNKAEGSSWVATEGKILFPHESERDWRSYVDARRLEISCGEAPYLVSRYDSTTGKMIPLRERIGLLDRKLRVVGENAATKEEWVEWATRAVQSVYGYEFQGDSLLLARENVFMTFVEYYFDRFSENPDTKTQKSIAEIVSWNLWQMDAMKYVVPFSCTETPRLDLFGKTEEIIPCPGCSKNNRFNHTGIYCLIKDWREGKTIKYIGLTRGMKSNGK